MAVPMRGGKLLIRFAKQIETVLKPVVRDQGESSSTQADIA